MYVYFLVKIINISVVVIPKQMSQELNTTGFKAENFEYSLDFLGIQ